MTKNPLLCVVLLPTAAKVVSKPSNVTHIKWSFLSKGEENFCMVFVGGMLWWWCDVWQGKFSCITSTSLTVGPSIKWFIVPQSTIIISSSHTDIDQDENKQIKILWTQICQMKCYNLYIWRLFELHELSIRDHFLLLSYTTFFWGTLLKFKLFKSLKALRKISFILLHPFSHFA